MSHTTTSERETLRELLHRYNERPEERGQILAEIDQHFRRRVAILVVDTCGFTRMVREAGIVQFLARLERLKRLICPSVEQFGGLLLHPEADNIFAFFPDPAAAVACADAILRDLRAANEALPAADEVDISIGIGYGDVLVIGSEDLYGDEMNLACKLGEDLARRDEVLLTPAARDALREPHWRFEQLHFSVSGLDVTAYRLVR